MISIIQRYLEQNGYRHLIHDFRRYALSHPEFPSIKSMTDAMDVLHIPNVAATVPLESFGELPATFVAHDPDGFMLVKKSKNVVHVIFEDGRKQSLSIDDFSRSWDGLIIVAEPSSRSKWTTDNILAAVVVAGLVVTWMLGIPRNAESLIFSLLAMVGAGVSWLVKLAERGRQLDTVEKVCKALNKKGGCFEVSQSYRAKLFASINLSDASMIFFVSIFVNVFVNGIDPLFMSIVLAGGIPFIIYSIYLQGVVLRQWCALCLTISATYTAMAVVAFFMIDRSVIVTNKLPSEFFVVLMISSAWIGFRNFLAYKRDHTELDIRSLRMKTKPGIFRQLQRMEERVDTSGITDRECLTFGEPGATIDIVSITNPTCGYCKDVFLYYDELRSKYKDDVRIRLIFNLFPGPDKLDARVADHVIRLYWTAGPQSAWASLKDWYLNQDLETWAKRFQVKEQNEVMITNVKHHDAWCKRMALNSTPLTIIGGYPLPKEYDPLDIPWMLTLSPQHFTESTSSVRSREEIPAG